MAFRPLARRFALAAVVAVAALAGSLAIPHDRYIRWQEMRSEAWARLGWIYERVHFDPTPIDIAFIGTSHSMNGVDGAAVQAALATAGGGCRHVVNFGFPSYGRNLHWLIARELLEHREVRTLVLEVFENESRKAHPFFINVADVSDIVEAPLLINLNYVTDIAQLPARQVMLGLKTLLPERFGLRRSFDPARYDGHDVDNTRQVQVGGVALTPLRDRVLPPAQLDRVAARMRAAKNTNMLGARFEALEYRYPRYYLDRILDLARQRGVTVKFLYLPGYAYVGAAPRDPGLYAGHGEVLATGDLLADPGYWYDPDHLNLQGAAVLSARLGRLLAAPRDGEALRVGEPAACDAESRGMVAAQAR
ncbi:hypothetical protein ACFQS7_28520 [Dankookia sp. GCM10030260]|uniref:hypothetical protein n=1 Tax=Dankookia sp. GCM10030260 TaxID=3273390 RepID=UPI003607A685